MRRGFVGVGRFDVDGGVLGRDRGAAGRAADGASIGGRGPATSWPRRSAGRGDGRRSRSGGSSPRSSTCAAASRATSSRSSANYRIRLAIVGELPEPAASSTAFAALVRESNAGTQHWFVPRSSCGAAAQDRLAGHRAVLGEHDRSRAGAATLALSQPARSEPMERLLLLDGNGLIYRGYFALIDQPLTTSKGELVTAVFGFTNIVLRAIADVHPDRIAVAFDLGKPTFRHERYAEYKAHPDADAGRHARADPEGPRRRHGPGHPGLRARGLRGGRRRSPRSPARRRRPGLDVDDPHRRPGHAPAGHASARS